MKEREREPVLNGGSGKNFSLNTKIRVCNKVKVKDELLKMMMGDQRYGNVMKMNQCVGGKTPRKRKKLAPGTCGGKNNIFIETEIFLASKE